jgi:tRNA (Thr-GGU) A37 N-methylase
VNFELNPIGHVESPLVPRDASGAAHQDQGGAAAWLVFDPSAHDTVRNLHPGQRVVVVTWLAESEGPAPFDLHRVEIIDIRNNRVHVQPLDTLDGTPLLDVKPIVDRET